MEKSNINFIFGLLNKKKVILCLFIEAFLDFIYYVIPYTFALFLTLPFTLEKAIIVASIFIASKSIRCFVLWLELWPCRLVGRLCSSFQSLQLGSHWCGIQSSRTCYLLGMEGMSSSRSFLLCKLICPRQSNSSFQK